MNVMNRVRIQWFTWLLCLLGCLSVSSVFGQSIQVKLDQKDETGFPDQPNQARVVFISTSGELMIDENNGTPMEKGQLADGKHQYRFVCDVTDTNKFKFNIALQRSSSTANVTVFVEEGNDLLYTIDVQEGGAKISEIKPDPNMMVYPVDNKAKVTVITTYPRLIVQSATGESVEGPIYQEENKQFAYSVVFDLEKPDSRKEIRTLRLSADNKEFVTQKLGALSPKQAMNVAVVVIQESCYQHNIDLAQNYFLNGSYREAYDIYHQLLTTDECEDKPADLKELQEDEKEMKRLANAYHIANDRYERAEEFARAGDMDSAMHYHAEAYKYRNYILKRNPSDSYALEYNKKYELSRRLYPRIVSGVVLDKSRMDLNGQHLPLANVYIYATLHERDTKTVGGQEIPWYGKQLQGENANAVLLGQTGPDGSFKVFVNRNTNNVVHVLHFSPDEQMVRGTQKIEYFPKEVDMEKNIKILLAPKGLNTYNKTK